MVSGVTVSIQRDIERVLHKTSLTALKENTILDFVVIYLKFLLFLIKEMAAFSDLSLQINTPLNFYPKFLQFAYLVS